MLSPELPIVAGMKLSSPAGRLLLVSDVFVPKNDPCKGRNLPASFRSASRKVVVFSDGSLAPLAEVKQRFHVLPTLEQQSRDYRSHNDYGGVLTA